jgi:hypothetical protein
VSQVAEYEGAQVATRRRRRGGRILLLVLLALLVLLVAVDRVGELIAEQTLASQARTQLASQGVTVSGDPSVSISGFPFLTQVASGRYEKIEISVDNPSAQGIRLDSLTVTATGVTASAKLIISQHGQIQADRVTGVGVISWTSFKQMIDLSGVQAMGIDPDSLDITSNDNGDMTINAPLQVAGQTVHATATGRMSVNHDIVHVDISNVTSDATGLAGLALQMAALQNKLTFDVRIPPLPFNMALDSVNATSDGVRVVAHADNVVLGR